MKVQKGRVVTTIKAGKKQSVFESGFLFRKKDKVNKKKLLELALKSAKSDFQIQNPSVIPERITQNVSYIAYFCYV